MIKKYLLYFCFILYLLIGVFVFSSKSTFALSGEVPSRLIDYSTDYFTSYNNLEYMQVEFVPNVNTAEEPFTFFTNDSFSYPRTASMVSKELINGSYDITTNGNSTHFSYTLNSSYALGHNSTLNVSIPNLSKITLHYGPAIVPTDPKYFTSFMVEEIDLGQRYDANFTFEVRGTTVSFNAEGTAISTPFTLVRTSPYNVNMDEFVNPYSLFSQSLVAYAVNGYVNISSMTMTIEVSNDFVDNSTFMLYFRYFITQKSNLPTTSNWYVFEYDLSQLGTSLLRGATNFLHFEVFPGFSLLNLLYLIISVPLLLAILRLFLGG